MTPLTNLLSSIPHDRHSAPPAPTNPALPRRALLPRPPAALRPPQGGALPLLPQQRPAAQPTDEQQRPAGRGHLSAAEPPAGAVPGRAPLQEEGPGARGRGAQEGQGVERRGHPGQEQGRLQAPQHGGEGRHAGR